MKEKKYVVDTSAVIEKAVTTLHKKKQIKGTILIPHAVISELENQANRGQEIGFIGLEEVQEIRQTKNLNLEFTGKRPNEMQIKFAKSGEIDALIREIAFQEKATLITGDKVQAESAKAFGLEIIHLEKQEQREKLAFEKFFDAHTMSVHLKENTIPTGKKGKPSEWELTQVSKKKLDKAFMENLAKEIVERARVDPKSMVEISRKGSTVVQYRNFRIVITKPPISDGWEITIIKPLKKLELKDYNLDKKIKDRLLQKATGIVVAGEPGSGKTTFTTALAEEYNNTKKIVKTIESPRDLIVSDEITQYSKNLATDQELHDILLLSRPDNVIFDEMRDTPDFFLYKDLRLAGIGLVGVAHSSEPIDLINRLIGKIDVGMIPSIVDTVLFIKKGNIGKILTLKLLVKVPSGMTESDLARPVVEVRDFLTSKLEYEIYSYGEQTVVIEANETTKTSGLKNLAKLAIQRELQKYTKECEVNIVNPDRISISVPERDIPSIIGKEGKTITAIEKKLGISIDVKELKREKEGMKYNVQEDKKSIRFYVESGREVGVFIDNKLLLTGYSSKKGELKLHKQSQVGRKILSALHKGRKIELRG